MNDISTRYLELIEELINTEIVKDGKELALTIGVSVSSITEISKGRTNVGLSVIQKTVSKFPDINLEWLIKGKGNIFNTKSIENVVKDNDHINDHNNDHKRKVHKTWSSEKCEISSPSTYNGRRDGIYIDDYEPAITIIADNDPVYNVQKISPFSGGRHLEQQQIPLYDFDAVAGLTSIFAGQGNPINYISIPDLPRCDGAVAVRGDSMYPLLKSGDIVIYKQINDFQRIMWGEMYLISFFTGDEEYISVKFIKRVEGDKTMAQLVSHNQHHAPMDIEIDNIRALALIKASIRFNTMG